ncbi:hypothetical protein LCX93_06575 [Sulfurimonas sp. SWIR-19]|uniref:hypothetical protein n=1 Tax=Sulfurimonas sp. SWIR-19 TaxID=2878390 RepID=UPI001CF2C2BB|nr:hypothetical protein [Sulfurimonas sp. SWIR-19]UCM99205.1 hypothetical protein LCX93_06575 [Sulfurimonas sp. SWIR-19]
MSIEIGISKPGSGMSYENLNEEIKSPEEEVNIDDVNMLITFLEVQPKEITVNDLLNQLIAVKELLERGMKL